MKKNTTKIFIAAVFLTISGTAFAQEGRVGINTSTPAATLDVVASPSIPTRIDGLIAPRLKGSELKSKNNLYTSDQDAAIVYVTEALALGDTDDKTTNVTSIGYYYFDKTQGTNAGGRWMKIANPSAAAIYQEPWNNVADGTPATSNTASIYQLGNVGIGTNAPDSQLHVAAGNTALRFSNSGADGILQVSSNATNNWARLGTRGSSLAILTDNTEVGGNAPAIYVENTKNVGVGTTNPSQKLDVNGTAKAVNLTNGGTALGTNDFGLYSQTSSWMRYVTATANHAWYTDGASGNNYGGTNPSMLLSSTGNLGIGTTNPSQKLDIETGGTSSTPVTGFKLVDGNQNTNFVLTSDANGVGTWKSISINVLSGVRGKGAFMPYMQNSTNYYYSGMYIDLPTGNWMVHGSLLAQFGRNNPAIPLPKMANEDTIWIRAFLTSTAPSGSQIPDGTTIPSTPVDKSSIVQSTTDPSLFSGLVTGYQNYSIMAGDVKIQNSSSSTQRYYLVLGGTDVNNKTPGHFWNGTVSSGSGVYVTVAGGWAENVMYAIPLN